MNLYLDDDSVDRVLVKLLKKAGHNVQIPLDVGLSGKDDPVHLIHAAKESRVFLSANYKDFRNLHDLIQQTGGVHPGILIVRYDNDPSRDMTHRAVVRAIENLSSAGLAIENHFIVLNHWR